MKFSCCLNSIYKDVPLIKAAKFAKESGFDTIEFWNIPENIDEFNIMLKETGLNVGCFIANRGASPYEDAEKFVETIKGSLDIAQSMNCKRLILSLDGAPEGVKNIEDVRCEIVSLLKRCADLALQANICLLLEPLNDNYNHPKCPLNNTDTACELIDEVGNDALKLLYDIYHRQLTHGDIINDLVKKISYIDYLHIAGVPGRFEPYDSEINYRYIAKILKEHSFDSIVGFEFFCKVDNPADAAKKTFDLFL